jgi:hypothetical protein
LGTTDGWLRLQMNYELSQASNRADRFSVHPIDPETFRKALDTCVASSTAIETGASIASIMRMLEEREETKPFTHSQGSAR